MVCIAFVLMLLITACPVQSDAAERRVSEATTTIHIWHDAHGVAHITNTTPPPDAHHPQRVRAYPTSATEPIRHTQAHAPDHTPNATRSTATANEKDALPSPQDQANNTSEHQKQQDMRLLHRLQAEEQRLEQQYRHARATGDRTKEMRVRRHLHRNRMEQEPLQQHLTVPQTP